MPSSGAWRGRSRLRTRKIQEETMSFDWKFLIPAVLGFLAGLLPPLIIERWKNKKEERRKIDIIENDITNLQNTFKNFSKEMEHRLTTVEERARALEINLSHNTGVLKSKLPDTPLEDTPAAP